MEEIKKLIEEQGKAWAEYRRANDERLAAIEAKGTADPLMVEKLDKISAAMDAQDAKLVELEKKAARPHDNFADAPKDALHREHKAAYARFITKGDTGDFDELRAKDVQISVPGDGGYAVPEELDRNILTLMRDQSPMRQVCSRIQIGGVEYKKLVDVGGTTSGWRGETDLRTPTNTPQLVELTPIMGEVFAEPAATQWALDDIYFDVEQWLYDSVVTEFAEQENKAFLNGDGVKKAKGILQEPQAAQKDGVRPFGTLELVSAATAGTLTGDDLITLIYKLKAGHRAKAHWMMNKATLAAVRMLKDGSGDRYLWQPSLELGQPSTLLGYPITENEDMPDLGAGGVPIMFGDFARAYVIVDRMGIRTLRDPYTKKGWVVFSFDRRVGGMLQDSEALKLMSV